MADKQAAIQAKTIPHRIENFVAIMVLALIPLLPLMETIARGIFKTGIPHSTGYIQHLVLWVCFVSGMITSREDRHLALSVGVDLVKEPLRAWIVAFTGLIAVTVTTTLFFSSLSFVFNAFGEGDKIGFVPIQLFVIVMPIGFAVMAVRFMLRIPSGIKRWVAATLGVILAVGIGWYSLVDFLKVAAEGLLLLFGREPAEAFFHFFRRLGFDPWDSDLFFRGTGVLIRIM